LVEVREAVRQILTQEKVIEATKKALELAEEQFQAELNRKRRQVSTTFNVLEMQTKVSEAQAREIQARIDYQKALVSLKVATGTLLLDMGIKLDEMLIPRTK
ncbi:MAG: TolC family protein, partial [Planctomycetota bacterium]|nr:TolC family protein [Planctomycetota bacterium]